ncbi:MAG: helix-turn-helix transcriptional regulator [Chloroflexi bacterium]|nr:helix-turn-helix transcriptional regulator [Chloroflexota bacterium]
MYRRELLKGSTETLLLALLTRTPMYGYQIVKEMERRSSGYFRFREGTLYPALHRLEQSGLVEGKWQQTSNNQPRRYYYITTAGMETLTALQKEWRQFSQAVNLVVSTEPL